MLRASSEIFHNQIFTLLSYTLPIDWLEQYRERITKAEHLILTTLNFELNVQHPYESLSSTLQKLGFSQSMLVNLALFLVGEDYLYKYLTEENRAEYVSFVDPGEISACSVHEDGS